MMTNSYKNTVIFCLGIMGCACNDGANNGSNDNAVVLAQENQVSSNSTTTSSVQQQNILATIKQRANQDGALYPFNEMNPVFEQNGESIKVSFEFNNPNTVGGSPIVEYSLNQSEITSIVYTQ